MSQRVFYRTVKVDGLSIFTGRRDRLMPQLSSCYMDCPPRRECSSLSWYGYPIAITW
jgi:hypothetical protein